MKYRIQLKGISPLMHHRFDPDVLTEVSKRAKQLKLTVKEKKEIAMNYLHTDRVGKVIQPSISLEMALRKAAGQFKFKGNTTFKTLVENSVFVFPEILYLKHKNWELDERSTVNKNTMARVMTYRPIFRDWGLECEIHTNDERVDKEVLKDILEFAGGYIGIGAGRKLHFGRFEIEKFTPLT